MKRLRWLKNGDSSYDGKDEKDEKGSDTLILYRTSEGLSVIQDGKAYRVRETSLDSLVAQENLYGYLADIISTEHSDQSLRRARLQAPIESQEVWASGVTYYRSRSARIEESKDAGGGDFYDRVYSAERPELFFKAVAHKVAGHDSSVRIRHDATWSVPEPELALLINPRKQIIGYTIGNDMSSRDIEGVNPLYLPQAKVYDRSCALGPGILIRKEPMPSSTEIRLEITRAGKIEFAATTTLAELKRDPRVLVEYLFRDQSFPCGCFLLTGTGIVPPDSFTLRSGDEIHIAIDEIGSLRNVVE